MSALSGNVDEAALKDRFRIDEGTALIPCVRRFGLVSLSIVPGYTAINTGIFKERAGYEGLLYKLLPPAAARKLKAGKVVSEATYQRARDRSGLVTDASVMLKGDGKTMMYCSRPRGQTAACCHAAVHATPGRSQLRKRSRFITLVHAATKSPTNLSRPSLAP